MIFEGDRWDTLSYSGDRIIPRYFSGMAVNKNREQHRSMYSYVRLSIDRCTATYV